MFTVIWNTFLSMAWAFLRCDELCERFYELNEQRIKGLAISMLEKDKK